MDVTESGMVNEASLVHPRNALYSMDLTELPMVTEVIESIPLNQSPMVGQFNSTDANEVHS
ncbi:MAG: hypothetical protein A3Q59_04165 [Methanomethylophilus alvi]|nr:MAG: hypothetical protein A3Q59_04165 [Methanomethylophilus alvi]